MTWDLMVLDVEWRYLNRLGYVQSPLAGLSSKCKLKLGLPEGPFFMFQAVWINRDSCWESVLLGH